MPTLSETSSSSNSSSSDDEDFEKRTDKNNFTRDIATTFDTDIPKQDEFQPMQVIPAHEIFTQFPTDTM